MIFSGSQCCQKTGIAALPVEADTVKPRQRVKMHEFIINLNLRVIGIFWNQPCDVPRNERSAVAHQYACPLIPFLNIKSPEILIALNRIADSFITEMGFAEPDPFHGKFRIYFQKRHEIPCQSRGAAGRFRPGNQFCRYIDYTKLCFADKLLFIHKLIQRRRIGIGAPLQCIVIISLPRLQGNFILL